MRLSIVIPAYNEEERLPRCLQAVGRELARTHAEVEIIVVNNASVDRTGDVAREYSFVRVVDEPRKGLVRARAAGYAAATGDLIANVDADTMLPQGWLDTVFAEFERDDALVALSGPFVYYDLPAFHRAVTRLFYLGGYVFQLISHRLLGGGGMLQGGNFIVRRRALDAIGGFDTTITFYGEDTDIARRIAKVGRVKWIWNLPMYASGRRLAKEGIVTAGWRYATNYFHTLLIGKPLTEKYIDIRE